MPTTYDPKDPSTYKYLPQMERERVERQRAFKREQEGTFAQKSALEREMKGTFEQNRKSLFDMENLRQTGVLDNTKLQNQGNLEVTNRNNAGAMARAILADETAVRGQDLAYKGQQEEMYNRSLLEGMRNQTMKEMQGYHYVPVDVYDTDPLNPTGPKVKSGQRVERYYLGQPMGGESTGQPSGISTMKHSPAFAEFFDSKSPEEQNQMLKELETNPDKEAIVGSIKAYQSKKARQPGMGQPRPGQPQATPGRRRIMTDYGESEAPTFAPISFGHREVGNWMKAMPGEVGNWMDNMGQSLWDRSYTKRIFAPETPPQPVSGSMRLYPMPTPRSSGWDTVAERSAPMPSISSMEETAKKRRDLGY